jgi:phage host-nuclease inhibitor protein Gam
MSNDLVPKDDFITQMQLAFQEHIVPPPSNKDRFCEWYVGEWDKLDHIESRIKEQSQKMLCEIDTARKSLQYLNGDEFKQRAQAMLDEVEGKKKSINLFTGTIGYRTNPARINIVNESEALAWSEKELPTAVKTEKSILKKPVMDYIKTTGEIPPGCELIESFEKFYPWLDGTPRLVENTDKVAGNNTEV